MQSIQPMPMRKVAFYNQRQSCRSYPQIDLLPFRDPLAISRMVDIEQGEA